MSLLAVWKLSRRDVSRCGCHCWRWIICCGGKLAAKDVIIDDMEIAADLSNTALLEPDEAEHYAILARSR
jgi:hypothetical protein